MPSSQQVVHDTLRNNTLEFQMETLTIVVVVVVVAVAVINGCLSANKWYTIP